MKALFISFILVFLYSCCDKENIIIYKHDKFMIERIDRCNITDFFIFENGQKLQGKISVKYSGINNGFSGYLVFAENNVKILSGDGAFIAKNVNDQKFSYKRIAAYERPIIGGNVYYINLATNVEIEKNIEFKSDIVVSYK